MTKTRITVKMAVIASVVLLAGCADTFNPSGKPPAIPGDLDTSGEANQLYRGNPQGRTTIWDAFRTGNEETTVAVNKYLWSASLEVLDFLPVQSVDPFTGVIITGFGTPPGGSRAYRATVLIDDPALDARSLNVSLQSRNGPASAATVRAVENAILTRARQIRNLDGNF